MMSRFFCERYGRRWRFGSASGNGRGSRSGRSRGNCSPSHCSAAPEAIEESWHGVEDGFFT